MKKGFFRKALVLVILFLFFIVNPYTSVTAINYDTKIEDETIDNSNESRSSDDYKEIITLIMGNRVYFNWIKRRGIFRGEVNLLADWSHGGKITLIGLGYYNESIKFFYESVSSVHAYHFIGIREFSSGPTPFFGFALGNFEWS